MTIPHPNIPEGFNEYSGPAAEMTVAAIMTMFNGFMDAVEEHGPNTGMTHAEFVEVVRLNAGRISVHFGVDLQPSFEAMADFVEATFDLDRRLEEDFGA